MNSIELREEIIKAGRRAVKQLIKVAKEEIIKPDPEDELAADRLKNAAATKKLAIFDAFEILKRIDLEAENILIESKGPNKLILNKDLQSEGQNSLYRIIKDYIPKQVRSKKNSGRTWLYGYNEKYDFVNISKPVKLEM